MDAAWSKHVAFHTAARSLLIFGSLSQTCFCFLLLKAYAGGGVELLVVAKLDPVARAETGTALTAQNLGVGGQQVLLLARGQTDEVVIGGGFDRVKRERRGQIARL